jgi:outer membrane protein OmpA-like peptidoglycan-associated protein
MNTMAKGFCVLLGSALLGAAPAGAVERAGKVELGLDVGVASYWGDLDAGDWMPMGDLAAHYWFRDNLAAGLVLAGTNLRAEEGNVGFKTPLTAVMGRVKYLPFRPMAVNPYLSLGLEWISFNAEDSENDDTHPAYHDWSKKSDTSALALPFGLGLSHDLNDNFSLNVEALYHTSTTDFLDDWEGGDADDGWYSVTAGLAWVPGKPRDTDGDGLIDKLDKCPKEPEDKDGYQDGDGCPDPDNDGDGILDVNDKCPDKAEDKDGWQDDDGCPDPDNDGDGILDVNDKCPDQAEDKDGYQDEDGCPDPDNDGDGILDVNDKCPNEPETVNGYKDEDGCPDKKPEVQVEAGKSIVLEGVNFDSGKATLKAESEEPLGKVLRTLLENPEVEVEIQGHTDNQGKAAMNRDLSQRRADTVKAWLVERGVAPERMTTKGFGPDQPVADNTTPEGRAQNRRIEFLRLK